MYDLMEFWPNITAQQLCMLSPQIKRKTLAFLNRMLGGDEAILDNVGHDEPMLNHCLAYASLTSEQSQKFTMDINGVELRDVFLDGGAIVNIVPKGNLQQLGLKLIYSSKSEWLINTW